MPVPRGEAAPQIDQGFARQVFDYLGSSPGVQVQGNLEQFTQKHLSTDARLGVVFNTLRRRSADTPLPFGSFDDFTQFKDRLHGQAKQATKPESLDVGNIALDDGSLIDPTTTDMSFQDITEAGQTRGPEEAEDIELITQPVSLAQEATGRILPEGEEAGIKIIPDFTPIDADRDFKMISDYEELLGSSVFNLAPDDQPSRVEILSDLRTHHPDYEPIEGEGLFRLPTEKEFQQFKQDDPEKFTAALSEGIRMVNEAIKKSRRRGISDQINNKIKEQKLTNEDIILLGEDGLRELKLAAIPDLDSETNQLADETVFTVRSRTIDLLADETVGFGAELRRQIEGLTQTQRTEGIDDKELSAMARSNVINDRKNFGINELSDDQRAIYKLVVQRDTKQREFADPEIDPAKKEELRAEIADLSNTIKKKRENPLQLYDPETGDYVDKNFVDTEAVERGRVYEQRVLDEMVKLPSTDLDFLLRAWDRNLSKFKYLDEVLYNKPIIDGLGTGQKMNINQMEELRRRELRIQGDPFVSSELSSDAIALMGNYRDLLIDTRAKFDAVNRALLLNEDPSGIDKGFFSTFLEHAGESIVREFTGSAIDISTDKDFVENFVDAVRSSGGKVTKAQEQAAKDNLSQKLAKGAGDSMGPMMNLMVTSYLTVGMGNLLGLGRVGAIIKGGMTTRFGKTGEFLYNITRGQMQGATAFGLTNSDQLTAAMGVGEGTVQGILDGLNLESFLRKSKFGKLLSGVRLGGRAIGVRPAEYAVRVGVGATAETAQEFTGDYLNSLEENGFNHELAFRETFGRDSEDFLDRLLVVGLTSAMFSGAFNTRTFFYAKSQVQAQEDSPKKQQVLEEFDKLLDVNAITPERIEEVFGAPTPKEIKLTEAELKKKDINLNGLRVERSLVDGEVENGTLKPVEKGFEFTSDSGDNNTTIEKGTQTEDQDIESFGYKPLEEGTFKFSEETIDKTEPEIARNTVLTTEELSPGTQVNFQGQTLTLNQSPNAPTGFRVDADGDVRLINTVDAQGNARVITSDTNEGAELIDDVNDVFSEQLETNREAIVAQETEAREVTEEELTERGFTPEQIEATDENILDQVTAEDLAPADVTISPENQIQLPAVIEPEVTPAVEEEAPEVAEPVAATPEVAAEDIGLDVESDNDIQVIDAVEAEPEQIETIKREFTFTQPDNTNHEHQVSEDGTTTTTQLNREEGRAGHTHSIDNQANLGPGGVDNHKHTLPTEAKQVIREQQEEAAAEVRSREDIEADLEKLRIGRISIVRESPLRADIERSLEGEEQEELLEKLDRIVKARQRKIAAKGQREAEKIIEREPIFSELDPPLQATQGRSIDNFVNNIVDKLAKSFPNIEVITDRDNFMETAKSLGFNESNAPGGFFFEGRVYLNPDKADASTAMEEFAHLWTEVARETNTSIYNTGIKLTEGSEYLSDVKGDKRYANLTEDQQKEEALARAIRDRGTKLEAGNKPFFTPWLKKFWAGIKRVLGISPQINMAETTLEEYSTKVAKELLGRTPISTVDSETLANIRIGKRTGTVEVDNSLLSAKGRTDRIITASKRIFTETRGAGAKLTEEAFRVKKKIERSEKEMDFVLKDFNQALTNHVNENGLKEQAAQNLTIRINKALQNQDGVFIEDLPKDLQGHVRNMREMVDDITRRLIGEKVIVGEEIEAILTQNLGTYLHRSYRKHDIPDYEKKFRDFMTEEQYNDSVNFLKDGYETSKIKGVAFEKTKDGVVYRFTNAAGVESRQVIIDDITKMEKELGADMVENIKTALKTQNKGELFLERPTGDQDQISFRLTSEQIDNIISGVLRTGTTTESIGLGRRIDVLGVGKIETDILRKRGEIDPTIRILMGEYLDPKLNFAKSLTRMSRLLEKGKWEAEMLAQGEGTFLTKNETKTNSKEITNSQSRGLNGFWTTPEVHNALFRKTAKPENEIVQALILLNGVTKAALTIFKDDSQARNFWGAAWNLLATGHIPTGLLDAVNTAAADFTRAQDATTLISTPLFFTRMMGKFFGKKTKAQAREDFLDAVEHGLLDQSIEGSIIKSIIDDVTVLDSPRSVWQKTKKFTANATELFSKPYQLSDSLFKVVQYKKEIRDLRRAFPDMSTPEIKRMAAAKTLKMQPTYSKSAAIFPWISKFPLLGSFVMFSAQMWRTRINILKVANQEMQQGIKEKNPELVRIASKRAVGLLVASSLTAIMAGLSKALWGWSDEEDAALARSFPSYSRNSQRLYISGDKKNPDFLDLTFVDPSSQFQKMAIALIRGEDLEEKFTEFLRELGEPFINPEIFTSRVNDVLRNRDQYGKEVANENLPGTVRVGKNIYHVAEVLWPGFINTSINLVKGAIGEETDFGKTFDFTTELANSRLGIKVKQRDAEKSFTSSSRRYWAQMKDSKKIFSARKQSKEKFQLFTEEGALEISDDASNRWFKELVRDYQAMRALGFTADEIGEIHKEAKIPAYMRSQIKTKEFEGIDEETTDFNKGSSLTDRSGGRKQTQRKGGRK